MRLCNRKLQPHHSRRSDEMKKSMSVCTLFLFAALFMAVNTNQAYAGWHEWSQSIRNQAIVDETANYNEGDDGGECKVWVQNVVNDASGSWLIPTNSGNDCYWSYGAYVSPRSGYIEDVVPGEIVQMELSSGGPHTAIVLGISPYGVTFIENNWCKPCHEIHVRYVNFDEDRKSVV